MFSIINDTKHAVTTYHNSRFGIKYYSFQSLQNAITSLGLKINRKKTNCYFSTIIYLLGNHSYDGRSRVDYKRLHRTPGESWSHPPGPPSLPSSVLCEHRLIPL